MPRSPNNTPILSNPWVRFSRVPQTSKPRSDGTQRDLIGEGGHLRGGRSLLDCVRLPTRNKRTRAARHPCTSPPSDLTAQLSHLEVPRVEYCLLPQEALASKMPLSSLIPRCQDLGSFRGRLAGCVRWTIPWHGVAAFSCGGRATSPRSQRSTVFKSREPSRLLLPASLGVLSNCDRFTNSHS